MIIKKTLINILKVAGTKYAGMPSVRGCYEPKVPSSLKKENKNVK